ncbi:MAG: UDP-N-acetyl glucosamine 2-epimerase [Firmicutes bacterium]|nr:UDP-N-acetyl glucosamine 2-epimerase [Bacillota bacterium]
MVASDIPVVLPLHPRTGKALRKAGSAPERARLRLIEPVGYLEMVCLEKNARLIATDSGGVQKEAFFYRVPCATLREETEWIELVELGWNRLVPPRSAEEVRRGVLAALDRRGVPAEPYGKGDAAARIVEAIAEF